MIYVTSDLHLNHNKEFVYTPRNCYSVEEMNEKIFERFSYFQKEDELYILGDLSLSNDDTPVKEFLVQLQNQGVKVYIIRGNHDTDRRIELYKEYSNVEVYDAKYLKYKGYHFYLTHFPCNTSNLEKENLKQMTLNLYGHTHQKNNFYQDRPYMYHVGVDSHNLRPVPIDQIIEDMNRKASKHIDNL